MLQLMYDLSASSSSLLFHFHHLLPPPSFSSLLLSSSSLLSLSFVYVGKSVSQPPLNCSQLSPVTGAALWPEDGSSSCFLSSQLPTPSIHSYMPPSLPLLSPSPPPLLLYLSFESCVFRHYVALSNMPFPPHPR